MMTRFSHCPFVLPGEAGQNHSWLEITATEHVRHIIIGSNSI